jgi:hypothetical protein
MPCYVYIVREYMEFIGLGNSPCLSNEFKISIPFACTKSPLLGHLVVGIVIPRAQM